MWSPRTCYGPAPELVRARSGPVEALIEEAKQLPERWNTQKSLALCSPEEPPVAPQRGRVFLLVLLWGSFGMSGWWALNSIMAELPLFVATLPAGPRLGNQLGTMTQVGNVMSIAYVTLHGHVNGRVAPEPRVVVRSMMTMALFSLLCSALFWSDTVGGVSVPLLILTFVAGSVGCLADVTYWSFAISAPKICTKAMGVGMTLGGLVVSGLSTVQLAGRAPSEPRFSTGTFLFITAMVQVVWLFVATSTEDLTKRLTQRPSESSEPLLDRRASKSNGSSSSCNAQYLQALNFVVYGATYTMPTLLPFVAEAYPRDCSTQLLLSLLVLQNVGDVLGRILAPTDGSRTLRRLWQVLLLGLPAVYSLFLVGAMYPHHLVRHFPCKWATWLLPVTCMAFYLCRGFLVTGTYIKAQDLASTKEEAQRLASRIGFMGQMGALSANFFAFLFVNGSTWFGRLNAG